MDLIYSENCLTGVILASSEKKKKVGCTNVESLRGKEGRPGPFEWNDKSCGIYAMTTWCELWIFAFSVTASSQKTVKNICDDDDGDGKSPTHQSTILLFKGLIICSPYWSIMEG